MRSSVLFSAVSSIALVSAQAPATAPSIAPAKAVTNNPEGHTYVATLPATATVQGAVSVSAGQGGKGVTYDIKLHGFPKEGGPFMYHVHEKPVPSDGNCTGAGAHLDPTKRGEVPPCNPATPAQCQVGDLSGKFGNVTAGPVFHKTFADAYSSLVKGDPQYIGDLSLVVHLSDKKRIGCANFTMKM
ncbi:Cu,Zn superoxide dismutase-like protein [Tothia fuscella]|uniref:superoxide dismutase n=1 Tax=Tothia fuscella TaxID=1048955 RepID=A0A9P4NU43_9PEZI|nr:Cu,Zn superoxide dismutase-like protein [Tothia fuscella]